VAYGAEGGDCLRHSSTTVATITARIVNTSVVFSILMKTFSSTANEIMKSTLITLLLTVSYMAAAQDTAGGPCAGKRPGSYCLGEEAYLKCPGGFALDCPISRNSDGSENRGFCVSRSPNDGRTSCVYEKVPSEGPCAGKRAGQYCMQPGVGGGYLTCPEGYGLALPPYIDDGVAYYGICFDVERRPNSMEKPSIRSEYRSSGRQ
jgi:hypothetical protein